MDGYIHHIETRNDDLVGEHHRVTGVEFESKVVKTPFGEVIEAVFLEFESKYSATLPESLYFESDQIQFSYANQQLVEAINNNRNFLMNSQVINRHKYMQTRRLKVIHGIIVKNLVNGN